jgi:pimeloyl-ACP methyl ester carboxylesterase
MMNRRSALIAGAVLGAAPVGAAAAQGRRRGGPPKERFVPAQTRWSLPNTRLWVWDTGGKGPPVILLHPATGSHAVWGYQERAFAQAGFRVIAYSRRGHYQSDAWSAQGTDADDLLDLMDHLKLGRAHVLGSAAGGIVALAAARKAPARMRSLVLASTIAAAADPGALVVLQPPGWLDLPADFRELSPSYRAANRPGVAQWLALEHHAQHGERPAGFRRPPATPLPAVMPPILALTGDADLYLPPTALRGFAAANPTVETAVFAEAGHCVYWEQPEGFNAVVLDFLRRHA